MKANGAPEKIYIEVTPDGIRYYRDVVKEQRTENSDIEYTRTDAFIEKAERYIRSVTDGLDRDDDVEAFISGFIKYMGGE